MILDREVTAHGVRSEVVELDAAQRQAVGLDQSWIERSTGEANFKGGCRGAPSECDRMAVVGCGVLEIELEGVVFSQVGRKSAVLKSVVKEAKPAAGDQFGTDLVGEAHPGCKIKLLRSPQSLTVLVTDHGRYVVLGQQVGEARRATRGERCRVSSSREQVQRTTGRRSRPERS